MTNPANRAPRTIHKILAIHLASALAIALGGCASAAKNPPSSVDIGLAKDLPWPADLDQQVHIHHSSRTLTFLHSATEAGQETAEAACHPKLFMGKPFTEAVPQAMWDYARHPARLADAVVVGWGDEKDVKIGDLCKGK